jgi:hypothetical protein
MWRSHEHVEFFEVIKIRGGVFELFSSFSSFFFFLFFDTKKRRRLKRPLPPPLGVEVRVAEITRAVFRHLLRH